MDGQTAVYFCSGFTIVCKLRDVASLGNDKHNYKVLRRNEGTLFSLITSIAWLTG